MTLTLAALLLVCSLTSTSSLAGRISPDRERVVRSVDARIGFLEARQKVHTYICRRGAKATKRFHCKALRWTTRELGEAQAERTRRDNTVPRWPWLTLAHCEQRTGPRMEQVLWTAYSETYEGGYGFTHDAWDDHRLDWMPQSANVATPRVQTIVARIIQRRYGWGSWPACSIRLGLR